MNDKILEILKLVAPGTELREGLENILKAKTGALIVVSDSEDILKIADGGFKIDEEFTSTNIYELAKLDGAIILSSDLKRIIRANVQLNPDFSISTRETGTRHKTAERVAKQQLGNDDVMKGWKIVAHNGKVLYYVTMHQDGKKVVVTVDAETGAYVEQSKSYKLPPEPDQGFDGRKTNLVWGSDIDMGR